MDAYFLPPDVVKVVPLNNRKVWVEYVDGLVGEADLAPLLQGPVFARLRIDDDFFRQVTVNEVGTIGWPDGMDIAPERLYETAILRVLA